MGFPDNPWADCVRGNLLNQYTPDSDPAQLFNYVVVDHLADFAKRYPW